MLVNSEDDQVVAERQRSDLNIGEWNGDPVFSQGS